MSPPFTVIAIAWGVLVCRAQKRSVHAIHWLMMALVVFKSITLMAQVRAGQCNRHRQLCDNHNIGGWGWGEEK